MICLNPCKGDVDGVRKYKRGEGGETKTKQKKTETTWASDKTRRTRERHKYRQSGREGGLTEWRNSLKVGTDI